MEEPNSSLLLEGLPWGGGREADPCSLASFTPSFVSVCVLLPPRPSPLCLFRFHSSQFASAADLLLDGVLMGEELYFGGTGNCSEVSRTCPAAPSAGWGHQHASCSTRISSPPLFSKWMDPEKPPGQQRPRKRIRQPPHPPHPHQPSIVLRLCQRAASHHGRAHFRHPGWLDHQS